MVNCNKIKTQLVRSEADLQSKSREQKNLELDYERSIENHKIKVEKLDANISSLNMQIKKIEVDLVLSERKLDIANFWKKGFSDSGIKGILLDESIPIMNEKAKELSNLTNNIKVRFDSQKALKSGDLRNEFSV